jgi:peptidoglycan/LPS O-acetylase OafA/YrhL
LNHAVAASTAVTWEETPRDEPAARRAVEIAGLTGLRGFAALMVVLIHTAVLTEYAWVGLPEYGPVSLFVLSGFLLYRPWARWGLGVADRPSVPEFARRRLARIFPAYLVVLVAVSVIYPPDRPEGLGDWVRAATLTWIYVPDDLRLSLFQTWSLGTELSWYVALPVLAGITGMLARRLTPRAGVVMTISLLCLSLPISAAWRWWVHVTDREAYLTYSFWLPAFLFCFAAGALVAHLTEAERAGAVSLARVRLFLTDRWALPVLALAVALIGTSSVAGPPGFEPVSYAEHQVRVVCATAVAVLLLVGVVLAPSTAPLTRILSTSWFGAVGRWSYGLYLWHLPVIVILDRDVAFAEGPLGLLLRLVMVLAIALPLGAATYVWVERPAIDWARRRYPRVRDRKEPGTSATTSTVNQPSEATPTAARSSTEAE